MEARGMEIKAVTAYMQLVRRLRWPLHLPRFIRVRHTRYLCADNTRT